MIETTRRDSPLTEVLRFERARVWAAIIFHLLIALIAGLVLLNVIAAYLYPLVTKANVVAFEAGSNTYNVQVMDLEHQLVRVLVLDDYPGVRYLVCSPDGRQIAFFSIYEGDDQLYVMNAAGDNRRRLTSQEISPEFPPTWSPDGTRLAYVAKVNGRNDIFVVDVQEGVIRNLTDNAADDELPTWSPTSETIAFLSGQDKGLMSLYTMDTNGTRRQQLTDNAVGSFSMIAWSPDGQQISFVSKVHRQADIFTMAADGTNVHQLTDTGTMKYNPMWSPDGRFLAYWMVQDGVSFLYAMDVDGNNNHPVAPLYGIGGPTVGNWFTWSPDGASLTVAYSGYLVPGIYVVKADGSGFRLLYEVPVRSAIPFWQPPRARNLG
jgi:Tol biopolymer transport system component